MNCYLDTEGPVLKELHNAGFETDFRKLATDIYLQHSSLFDYNLKLYKVFNKIENLQDIFLLHLFKIFLYETEIDILLNLDPQDKDFNYKDFLDLAKNTKFYYDKDGRHEIVREITRIYRNLRYEEEARETLQKKKEALAKIRSRLSE